MSAPLEHAAHALPEGPDDPASQELALDRALAALDRHVEHAPGGASRLFGRDVLVLGPDPLLAEPVLLACLGARVTAVGRQLPAWDDGWHGPFFAALLERLRATRRSLSPDPILALLEQRDFALSTVPPHDEHHGGHDGEPLAEQAGRGLRLMALSDHGLEGVADSSQDVVLSAGALQETHDLPLLMAELARVTRAGGNQVHHLDLRETCDSARPLEHLTLDREAFDALFHRTDGACGNRWLPAAMAREADAAGLMVLRSDERVMADDDYLDELLPRLAPEYAGMSRDGLRTLACTLVLRRRTAPSTEYPVPDDAPQTLAHSRCRYAFAAPLVPGKRVLDVGCGAGLGTRELLDAGAAEVIGLDARPEALTLARQLDPRDAPDGGDDPWVLHDLERGLPFDDGRFDLVVALEVLEHVHAQADLVAAIRRVLAPGGVALISIPHRPFELFWTELAGEPNPYHHHVPDLPELAGLLHAFTTVDYAAQVDMVSSVVLPLAPGDGPDQPGSTQVGQVELPAHTRLADHGTITVIATAWVGDADAAPPAPSAPPRAFAWGDHQTSFGGAMRHNQDLARYADALAHHRDEELNRLRWRELEHGPAPG